MSCKIKSPFGVGLGIGAAAFVLHMGIAAAGENHRHHQVAHHPWRHVRPVDARRHAHPAYAASDPLYVLYNYLKDGTEWCWLPTEPCDNNHRMTN